MAAILYIIATPIGNLKDFSERAITVLKEVDLICSEDTRRSKILLDNFAIKTPLLSMHKFNENERLAKISELLNEGKRVAIISDAGTPGIADPGALIVEYSKNTQVKVIPIPGASAVTTILSVAALKDPYFSFLGFLPHRRAEKEKFLKTNIRTLKTAGALVFFESPLRIMDSLELLSKLCPESEVVIGRELTKIYEEIIYFKAKNIPKDLKQKGEFVVVLKLEKKDICSINMDVVEKESGSSETKKLAVNLSNYLGIKTKEAYDLLIDLKSKNKKTT